MNPTTIHDLPAAWRADPHANADGCARQLEEMLASMQVPAEIRTPDHPEANGRKPQFGEQEYVFGFIDEDGRPFSVRMGAEGWRNHSQHVLDMLTEAPSYNDCSLETRNALASQLAKVTAERDELQAMLSKEQRWRIEAEERPQAERDQLRLDVAELTGRLRERTDAMLERQVELRDEARKLRKQRDTLAACLQHLRKRDWFEDGTTGDVVCTLDADRVRDALNSIDASPTAAKCGQCADTPGGASIINDG